MNEIHCKEKETTSPYETKVQGGNSWLLQHLKET